MSRWRFARTDAIAERTAASPEWLAETCFDLYAAPPGHLRCVWHSEQLKEIRGEGGRV